MGGDRKAGSKSYPSVRMHLCFCNCGYQHPVMRPLLMLVPAAAPSTSAPAKLDKFNSLPNLTFAPWGNVRFASPHFVPVISSILISPSVLVVLHLPSPSINQSVSARFDDHSITTTRSSNHFCYLYTLSVNSGRDTHISKPRVVSLASHGTAHTASCNSFLHRSPRQP